MTTVKKTTSLVMALVLLTMALPACTPMLPTTFVHPDFNFSFVRTVAVVPFENLSDDRGAGARMTRYFVSELLATGAFSVVEPGEVSQALQSMGVVRTAELTKAQILELGQKLGAQGLFLGSVPESGVQRAGGSSEAVVTLDVRLVETETGEVVWSTTHSESGRGFWNALLGGSGASLGEVSRRTAKHALERLVQ